LLQVDQVPHVEQVALKVEYIQVGALADDTEDVGLTIMIAILNEFEGEDFYLVESVAVGHLV